MATIYAADTNKLIEEAAKELEKIEQIKAPEWAGFVKTGHFRQKPPVAKNWWYVRAAAVLRSIYRLGPIGTSKLRAKYGGKKNRGVRPEHAFKGSGNIIRKILQQLDAAGLTENVEKGKHKGRKITGKGRSLLDKIATRLYHEQKKAASAETKSAEKKVEKKPAAEKPAEKKEEAKPTAGEKPAPAEKKPEAKPTEEKKSPVKAAEEKKETQKAEEKPAEAEKKE